MIIIVIIINTIIIIKLTSIVIIGAIWTSKNYRAEQLGDKLKFVFSPDVILCGWLGSKHQLTN